MFTKDGQGFKETLTRIFTFQRDSLICVHEGRAGLLPAVPFRVQPRVAVGLQHQHPGVHGGAEGGHAPGAPGASGGDHPPLAHTGGGPGSRHTAPGRGS